MSTLLLLSGTLTSTTYTLMMRCSRLAATHLQGTHYALLSTVENFGKVVFVFFVDAICDILGYQATFLGLLLLSFTCVQLLRYCPSALVSSISEGEVYDSECNSEVDLDLHKEADHSCKSFFNHDITLSANTFQAECFEDAKESPELKKHQ